MDIVDFLGVISWISKWKDHVLQNSYGNLYLVVGHKLLFYCISFKILRQGIGVNPEFIP